jgi:hypothetical protein
MLTEKNRTLLMGLMNQAMFMPFPAPAPFIQQLFSGTADSLHRSP